MMTMYAGSSSRAGSARSNPARIPVRRSHGVEIMCTTDLALVVEQEEEYKEEEAEANNNIIDEDDNKDGIPK
jgi:hypothetical protein